MIVAPSLHEGARRGLNYAGKMVERFYGRKKRCENNECLRLVMKSSVKHITTYSVMMPSQRWLRKKKACTLFPWTWVATLILSQHLFVTWHFCTHLLLSKYVYEQLLLLHVGVSFVLHCFLRGLHFFSNYSSCLLFICFSVPTQTLLWKPHLVIGVPMRSAEQEHLQKCLCPSEWNGVHMRSAGEEVEMTKQVQKW